VGVVSAAAAVSITASVSSGLSRTTTIRLDGESAVKWVNGQKFFEISVNEFSEVSYRVSGMLPDAIHNTLRGSFYNQLVTPGVITTALSYIGG
jgi:hypothetical protein